MSYSNCSITSCSALVLVLNIIVLISTLVMMTAGTFGGNWHDYDSPTSNFTKISLWGRSCRDWYRKQSFLEGRLDACDRVRPDFFEFSKLNEHYDVAFVLLIIASSFCLTSLLVACSMICNFGNPNQWRRKGIAIIILTFIGAVFADAAILYERIERDDPNGDYSYGWSMILTWVSGFFLTLIWVFAFLFLCCIPKPPPTSYGQDLSPYPYDTYSRNGYIERDMSMRGSEYSGYSNEAFTQTM